MSLPLVCCIMPTRNREQFIPQAVECFNRQTWPAKQLVVVDNSDSPIAHLLPPDAVYTYVQGPKQTTGWMRNTACSLCMGDYICHWDDDDYSAPGRIAEQVRFLCERKVGFVGYHSMCFIDESKQAGWIYAAPPGYALGTSFFYKRVYWLSHRFPQIEVGEDNAFVQEATDGRLATMPAGHSMVARIHDANTSKKEISPLLEHWSEADYQTVKSVTLQ